MHHHLSILPRRFLNIVQWFTGDGQLTPRVLYGSRSHRRYVVCLEGRAWLDKVRDCLDALPTAASSNATPPNVTSADLESARAWERVIIKLQDQNEDAENENMCHARISAKCPELAPRLLFGFTVSDVRVSFIECLDDCRTVYDLRKARSDLLNENLYEHALGLMQRMWTEAGVLHCDMHTNNAMVSASGRMYIIDFGMAVVMQEDMRRELQAAIREEVAKDHRAKKGPWRLWGGRGAAGGGGKRVVPPAGRNNRDPSKGPHALVRAYNRVCRDYALDSILDRGYHVSSGDDDDAWNDDGSFLETLRRYTSSAS